MAKVAEAEAIALIVCGAHFSSPLSGYGMRFLEKRTQMLPRSFRKRSLGPLTNECRSDKRGQGAPDVLDWTPKWAYTALLGSDFRRLICEGETHGFETA